MGSRRGEGKEDSHDSLRFQFDPDSAGTEKTTGDESGVDGASDRTCLESAFLVLTKRKAGSGNEVGARAWVGERREPPGSQGEADILNPMYSVGLFSVPCLLGALL